MAYQHQLSPRRQRFVYECVVDYNGTQAAPVLGEIVNGTRGPGRTVGLAWMFRRHLRRRAGIRLGLRPTLEPS